MSEQEALLATKLYVPRRQAGFVVRPRLVDRLDRGLERGLILVCAPAGSGKTALLADWAGRSQRPLAWLSLDAGDNDPARFWRHAAAALERVRPGIGDRVGPLLGPSAPSSSEGLVTALINEMALDSGETVLVLDDYHLIEAQPVHAALGFLIDHLPPGMHLILASRSDPPLALPRLRALGQLTELRAADLRFSADEAAALLSEAAGPGLAGEAVDALTARTEGWAAGLQLAALSLRGQADVTEFVATFSGSHRYVLDYLAGEVLDRQTGEIREFLLETSVLERLSGELCDAVTGRPGGQAMLDAIERANLFLVPLDDVRGWWRYHQLFADLLRVRLRQQQPDRVTALHRAAAAWHEAHGLADDAVQHAVAADDTAWAARLIEQNFDAVYFTGESATLRRWLAQLSADLIRSRPRLGLALAYMALASGDISAVTPLEAAEHASTGQAEAFEPSAGRAGSLLANVPAAIAIGRAWLAYLHGDAEGMATFAARARRRLADGEWMLESLCQLNAALADWLRGRLDEAERGFAEGIAGWLAHNQRGLAVAGCNFLGQVQRGRGRLDAAAATYQRILDLTAPDGARQPLAGYGHVGLAEVAYQRNDLAAARAHAAQGTAVARQLSETQPLANGLATLALVRQAEGDAPGALDAIGEAERAAPSPAVANLLNPVPALRARLLLAQGDLTAAARWAQERAVGPDDSPTYAREQEYLLLARVLLAQDLAGQALALLERLLAGAAAQGRTGSVIEIRALQALALAAAGDEDAAVGALADALTLGCPQGYVRAFADEGPPMAALLARLVAAQRSRQRPARGVPLDCLARVRQAFAGHDAAAGSGREAAASGGMIEPLTARELEVLKFLAAGASNQHIAGELVVTLDTVKKHVSHIFGKLGAASRTEAVARARQLGVLR
ncbi:MAG TPA: LuxR C-terminal-related transcriptional regulator [Streptosporangiaceae bacterium]|nr:LuxR C-terminal-related transcriptional regulator [Streptosporangiaceae bacterium]